MKRTTKNAARKGQLAVVGPDDYNGLLVHFAQRPELFAPMLNLIASGKQTIEAVMNQAGLALVELLLQLSASSIAGEKSPGRHSLARQSRRTDLPAGEAAQGEQAEAAHARP